MRHQLDKDREGGGTSEGYGSVPFHRVEYTAAEIRVMCSIDVELIRSYGLGDAAGDLLTDIAQWEVATLLTGGMRLRTACDLEVVGDVAGGLPDRDELAARIRELLPACRDVFGDGNPLTVEWKGKS